MKTMAAVILILAWAGLVSAKDHSGDYKMGTLQKVPLHVGGKVTTGFTDTTSCDSGLLGVHCTGGIVDDYSGWLAADMPDGTEQVITRCVGGGSFAAVVLSCDVPFVLALTEEDGTLVFLHHALSHDSTKALDTVSKVLYRVEPHHFGEIVTYIGIPDPNDPKKEGRYYIVKLPKPEKSAVPGSDSNVAAMCAGNKLSPELRAKYCH